ncbi:phosphatase PAP2 family protein [Litchfieldia salsa]|uniref:Undecaprenyl-diphosphatase n=1 Tax=Litchfieldia salsa TaxID=930152 RepID=A0A1H0PFC2_9BACI|nr:phosphatase PAP2 family protein [Litchfieldia salsa]SDP03358.1 Undecaprenyl-diphosphatase [Litchfieldia salsa]
MNQMLFKKINQLAGRNSIVDSIMVFASNKLRYIYAIALLFIFLRNRSKKKVFIVSVLSIMVNIMINTFVNYFKFKPRPFLVQKAKVLIPVKKDSTYTSKHTLLTFASSTIIYIYHKKLGIIMFLLSTLTGISRVWTAAHYPYDVIRSALIGTVISYLSKQAIDK